MKGAFSKLLLTLLIGLISVNQLPVNSQTNSELIEGKIPEKIANKIEEVNNKTNSQLLARKLTEKIANKIDQLKKTEDKWIEINVQKQRLIAWEGNQQVYAVIISTGKKSTPTPMGTFDIKYKLVSDRMKGEGYDLPKVPYVMYYDTKRGFAIHGADWHRNFGTPVSHGCTNVAVDHAEWLFNWAEVGTPVVIGK